MRKSNRIEELDSLRAIAAISVMMFHYTYGFNHNDSNVIFHYGYLGVELFFVISGFVIFMTLQNTKTAKDFILSRFSRLYPAYWFSVILSSILFSITFFITLQRQPSFIISDITIGKFLANLTMIQSFFGIEHIDGVYWTLTVELVFYVVMALLLLSNKLNQISFVGWIYVILLFLVYRYLKFIDIHYIRYGLFFLSGIIFFKLYAGSLNKKQLINNLLLMFFILALNLKYFYHGAVEKSIVVAIYLIFVLLITQNLKWLRLKPLVFLGQISYSMYLLHENIGSLLFGALESVMIQNLWIKIFLTSCIIFLLSYFSYSYFEVRLRKMIIRKFK